MKRTFRILSPESMRAACRELVRVQIDAPHELTIRPAVKKRTDPQLRTLWMWHTEIAPQLTLLSMKDDGPSLIWTKELVHEALFKPFFCKKDEIELPGGKVVTVLHGTSKMTREQVSEAMDRYRAWIAQHEWEVTDPEDARW